MIEPYASLSCALLTHTMQVTPVVIPACFWRESSALFDTLAIPSLDARHKRSGMTVRKVSHLLVAIDARYDLIVLHPGPRHARCIE